ncbi:MAG: UPF0182 family protein [Dehalococcoidia bacterium]|nr:UPF0182 family protein [Dehalococcoidia bacterium]
MGFFEDRGGRGDRGDLGPPPDPFRFGNGDRELRSPVPLRWIAIAAVLLVVFVSLNVLKSIYVDVLWFQSVDYAGVFRRVIVARVSLFFTGALITAAVLGVNIWLARRLAPRGPEESFIEEVDPEAIRRIVMVLLVAGTLFFAVIFGSVLGGGWEVILRWMNGVSFGQTDSQFGRDISFYIFDLPAYEFIQGWALGLMVVSALAAAAVYGLSISLQRFEVNITRGMRIHLSILVGLILLLIGVSTYLSIFDLVSASGGIVYGATYTDVHARLPARYVIIALTLFAAAATIANAFLTREGFRLPLFAIGLWAFAGIIGGVIYPSAVQSLQVEPNEREREFDYIARNIAATRYAWGLNEITETPYPAENLVSEEDIAAFPETMENIRLLDPRPLRDTINQLQAIRQFYHFEDVDIDRYPIDEGGVDQQVLLSARELDLSNVQDRNWTRERLQLTHGYGAVVTPVNEVRDAGLPMFITSDIPPQSEEISISPEGSRIYFGEMTNHYVVVKTNEPEFDYPLGEGNTETFYEPDQGIRVSSIGRRLALAWQLGDGNLLISGQINNDSRVLLHRNIRERVNKVAPFLLLDSDPYLVVVDDQLKWIQPAYTVADEFPYSQPTGGINYMRDSVQVVIDATTGEMDFYLVDEQDPVVATWAKIFPELFTPDEEMPEQIRSHLRYPLDMFKRQAQQYLRYHITDPNVFFIGEDFWNIPTERAQQQSAPMEPYYVTMTLPGEDSAEFVLILPFTPNNRPNTVAWLAGRSDGDVFGTLRAYRFPTGDLVFGPSQVEARIDQDALISQQLSLWDRAGSEVFRGNMLMIPIGESFLFVQPIYLRATQAPLPELRRVIVANGNNIAMEPTLDQALDVIFGRRDPTLPSEEDGGVITPPPGATPTPAPTATPPPGTATPPPDLPANLQQLLEEARRASDAAEAELERLREVLDALEALGAGGQP